jgi:hypothetical protein
LPAGIVVGAAGHAPRACDGARGLTGYVRAVLRFLSRRPGDRGFESCFLQRRVPCEPNADEGARDRARLASGLENALGVRRSSMYSARFLLRIGRGLCLSRSARRGGAAGQSQDHKERGERDTPVHRFLGIAPDPACLPQTGDRLVG